MKNNTREEKKRRRDDYFFLDCFDNNKATAAISGRAMKVTQEIGTPSEESPESSVPNEGS